MNKEIYETPELEIVMFAGADVITTSVGSQCLNWFTEYYPGCSDYFFTTGSGATDCLDNNKLYEDTGICVDPTMMSNQGNCIYDSTTVS